MTTLSRQEARTRARQLTVHSYTIHLDLGRDGDTFGSTTTIHFTAHHQADTFVELRPTTLHGVTLDGRPLDVGLLSDGRLRLTDLTAGEHTLYVTADMPYSRTSEGMHRFTDPADGRTYLYSMCFQTEAPRVYACFDQPDLKATFTVSATTPEDWTFLTNSVATQTRPGHWTSPATPPISTYLMAAAAGPYHSHTFTHAGLPFGVHTRRSLAEHLDAEEIQRITTACYDHYHEIFDEPYPFDSYDQLFAPELNAGAMENPGLVVLTDSYVHRSATTDNQHATRATTIAHEMAHMWFGNLVTLQWWDDIWLNESFAEYMGTDVVARTTEWTDNWARFTTERKTWGRDADQRPSTHPIAPDPEDVPDTATALQNFDGISYAKGASALRQLAAWLGREDFLLGLNTHFTRHRFGNATLEDFLDNLARHTNRDVRQWAARWLRTTGADVLVPGVADADADTWLLHVHKDGNRPHRLLAAAFDRAPDGTLAARPTAHTDLPADERTTTLTLPGDPPDLVVLNDQDLTYAKTRFDERSWQTLRTALTAVPDPLTRVTVWSAARDLVRDAELPPGEYLRLVEKHLPHESDNTTVAAVLEFVHGTLLDRYLDPADRPDALGRLHDLTTHLLAHTEEHDRRLTVLPTHIGTTTRPTELTTWLDGTGTLYGVPLDADRRWLALRRLTVLGQLTASELDEEAAADRTANGEQAAARCRAALPDAAAKARAWELMFGAESALSNYLFSATAQGFWPAEQRELTEPYLKRYFPDALALAHRRGETVARLAGRQAFPHTAAEDAVLEEGRRTLAEEEPPPALRRALTDELDDLARALRVREA
ncbi:aminopeptidase N [Streptomyces alkaliterrae]|nr:aminopeptidase N [Streptomyces alkaliterrae]MBB1259221.1 aminopeptidase N [Streptomyces alkaliterrae]